MNYFNLKTIAYVVGAVVLVALGVWYAAHYTKPAPSVSREAAHTFVGGLVKIGATTLTIKAADGTEKQVPYSSKTRVISQVRKGEVGRTAMQLGAGDVVSFAVDNNGGPVDGIELLPIVEQVRPAGSVVVAGTVVAKTATSITVRPPEDPAMSIVKMNADKVIQLSSSTILLTQVLGGEAGKGSDALFAGVAVKVFAAKSGDALSADIIELLR